MAANILDSVLSASQRVEAATVELHGAIVAASLAGVSNREIARHCHLSHERVRQIVKSEGLSVARLGARLAELDGRWDAFIAELAHRFMPDEKTRKAEQAYRNVENARARRQAAGVTRSGRAAGASGRKSRVRPTVTVEARNFAETFALRYLEENSAHPVCVNVLRELDEAAALREQLDAIQDSGVPFLHD